MMIDVYQKVTDQILDHLQNGASVQGFQKPWISVLNQNPVSDRLYKGINQLLLSYELMTRGYELPFWATYKQWKSEGACVRRGEKSSFVVFFKRYEVEEDERKDGKIVVRSIPVIRGFNVFNIDQVDGYEGDLELPSPADDDELRAWANSIDVKRGNSVDIAAYDSKNDCVYMPPLSVFKETERYYSVLAHEFSHSTGHESRLDRDLSGRFGDRSYAAEELVAEMGASFCMARLGREATPREDHAQYIESWIGLMEDDKKAVVHAASKAQLACDWLFGERGDE